MNLFKEFYYDINLTPLQTISKIKAKTVFSNRIVNTMDEFEGSFKDNSFKIHYKLPGTNFVHNSCNPNFYGKAEDVNNHTRLSIKMRPNALSYAFVIIPGIIFLVSLYTLIYKDDFRFFIAMLIIFLGSTFFVFFGTLRIKYKNIKITFETLFKNELLKT